MAKITKGIISVIYWTITSLLLLLIVAVYGLLGHAAFTEGSADVWAAFIIFFPLVLLPVASAGYHVVRLFKHLTGRK